MPKEKNLLDRLINFYPKHSNTVKNSVILALYPDIKKAVAAGWSLRKIWQLLHHEQKIKLGYQAFYENVKKLKNSDLESNKKSHTTPYNPIPNKADLI